MARVIAFDVNETLLDLSALDPHFERAFGSAAVRQEWFALMLQLAFVGGLTGSYVDFGTAQRAALAMVAERYDAQPPADAIAATMRELPPHPDVAEALDALRAAGLPVAALTNSTLDAAQAQLANAGLAERFDGILSADEVKALKPRREAYALVAERFDVDIGDVRLVAAHAWDIAGAAAAGCATAFVARPGKVPSPLSEPPEIVADDLRAIARRIIRIDG